MLDHVLKAQAIGLVFEFALMTIHNGGNPDLRHEDSRVADKGAGGKARYSQADSRAAGFFDLTTIVHLEDVSHLMAQHERELRFVFEGTEQTGINQECSVGQRGSVDFRIFHDEETEFDGAASTFRALGNQGIAQLREVLLDGSLRKKLHSALHFFSLAEFENIDSG